MTLKLPFPNDSLTYGAEWLRYLAEVSGVQEGVVGAGDMKVTAAAGGGMRVDIAAGSALVKGDSGTPGTGVSQGLFLAVNDASIPNAVTLPASNGTNPRIDQIALRVRDKSDLGTGFDDLTFVFLSGAATAGATLDNRAGAVALPADHLRIADVLVPAGSSAVTAGNVRDRRPWARGFHQRLVAASSDIAIPSGGGVGIFGTRAECTPNNAVQVGINLQVATSGATAVHLSPTIDGTVLTGTAIAATLATSGGSESGFAPTAIVSPSAGSRLFGWYAFSGSAPATIRANATVHLVFILREIVGGFANANG